ncbi:phage antirepressor [Lactiplantibacillus modestisalitolerans]|uniref:Phage antirepressor n=1 Tax=Lactiplantibacillus modestisalitolerans TaxID=1457219 RepID=A0ABV5WVE0_9LACO|nr:phage antirepressor [Lactiplantibacillus modestisalitolerans]
MNEVSSFDFNGSLVRTVIINNEPYFVGKDSALAIGYTNTRKAIRDHVKSKYRREERIGTPSGVQTMTVIAEPGVYQLASQSKLPTAEPFQDWVYEQVLPTIRKHGAYMTDAKIEEVLTDPDTIIKLATQLKDERAGRQLAEQKVKQLQPKADYYDRILANTGLITTTSIAKNYGMSAVRFNQLLHDAGVQFNQSGSWYLYSKYQRHGYTHTVPIPIEHRDGRPDVKMQTKWTQRGHKFIYELLKKLDVLPMIEREAVTA